MQRYAILIALLLIVLAAFSRTRAQEAPIEVVPEAPTDAPEESRPCCDDDVPEPVSYAYEFTIRDRLLASQACVHEATWAGGTRTFDCGGIIQVVMNRRDDGETFEQSLAQTMPRFYGGRTSRAWVRELRAAPIRENPTGWPWSVPASHYSRSWRSVYARVDAHMSGAEPFPCSGAPTRWLGRVADSEMLARDLASGRWREARCGEARGDEPTTTNAFLERVRDVAPG